MCVAVAETSSLGGQVVKVLKLPRLPRRLGVNVNYGRLFPRVFSGIGFLGFPLLLVITWLKLTVAFFSHWFFLLLLWSSTVLKYHEWYTMIWLCKTSSSLASGDVRDPEFELWRKMYRHVPSAMIIHGFTSSRRPCWSVSLKYHVHFCIYLEKVWAWQYILFICT